ncbi:MAG TPA: ABC transporter permease [Candidatus Saccharimonadales bacterium]|nr:ABC transporter permease [Candidatus Saccharimonadales bacterium]
MSTIARGNIKMALASVRSAKWRSMLTMLGVIIGIVSVVMVVGIGEGVKREVTRQVDQFGKDLITIRPGAMAAKDNQLSSTDLVFGLNSISGLTARDLGAVEKAGHVRVAAPLSVIPGSVKAGDRKMEQSLVIGTNHDLPAALNRPVPYGDFFAEKDSNANVAVIGRHVAQTLFDDYVPLGQSFEFRGYRFIVRGMFDDFKTTPLSPASNFNDAIFIPHQVAEKITGNSVQMYSILAKPDKPENTQAAISAIDKALYKAHGHERDFSVLNQKQNLATSSDVLSLLTTMIAAVAAISLLVGGVGIMNIMLASVTERTHEIGVRKAVGATNRQILNQFVMESAVLSLVGGVVGVVISLASVLLLRLYTPLKPVVSWEAIALATGTSLVIGIVFGVAPAIKAARKDPIEALRHD